MKIKQYVWSVVDSNSWLIVEDSKGLLIDAVDSIELYKELEHLDELTIVLTHSHFDHISGLNKIREQKANTVVISTCTCSEYLGNIYKNMSASAIAFLKFYKGEKEDDVEIQPIICEPSERTFKEQFAIEWFGHKVELCAVHGHSADGLIAIVDGENMFSGDTLLHIPTVTRFPTGNGQQFWYEDIPFLRSIKGVKNVYPGHGGCGELEKMISINKMPEKYK